MVKQLTTKEIIAIYGQPGDENNLTTIILPYPFRYAGQPVNKMRCHKLVADRFLKVFTEILETYGLDRINELKISNYAGCYNFRKMRGGTDWSRHSWGIAIDLWPERNGLKTPFSKAEFSKPEYKPMMDIFYKHGFLNLGKERNYDTMHFETFI